MAEGDISTHIIKLTRSSQKGNKGNKTKNVKTIRVGDEESFIEGSYEVGESSQKILYLRGKGTTAVKGTTPRNHPKMHDQRFTKREAFYNTCINCFKEYYAYPKNYLPEEGDRVILKLRKLSLATSPNVCGIFFASIGEAQNLKLCLLMARELVEWWNLPHAVAGAKPYNQRREEIDEEREAKRDKPTLDDEFLTMVYDSTEPAMKDLQEKMKKVRAELEPEFNSPTDA